MKGIRNFLMGIMHFQKGIRNFLMGNMNFQKGIRNFLMGNMNFLMGIRNFLMGNKSFQSVIFYGGRVGGKWFTLSVLCFVCLTLYLI